MHVLTTLVLTTLAILLSLAALGADPHEAARDVTLTGTRPPAPSPGPPLLTPVPEPVPVTAGRLLLHRRGCTGCHDLDLPAYPHDHGPALDHIGAKTHPAWLELWLRDPTLYLPHSRMPRVRLGDAARSRLVLWLAQLGPTDSADETAGADETQTADADVYRGGRLFDGLRCRGCHAAGGNGGHVGPALDRLGWKVRPRWLLAALRDPASHGLDAESHPYVLSVRDATDLSAFLLRRFAPPSGPETSGPETGGPGSPNDSLVIPVTSAEAGLAEALRQGCFQCHGVSQLRGPHLRLPVDSTRADWWLSYHARARGPLPAMPLTARQAAAMAAVLRGSASPSDTAADAAAAPPFWDLPIAAQGQPPELFEAGRRLEPASCGQCHEQQLLAWSASRHAQTFSPGLRAMLVGASPGFQQECLSCHTPRQEQITRVQQQAAIGPDVGPDTSYGPSGVDCAGCHVRVHRYYGPGQSAQQGRPVASTFEPAHHGGTEVAAEMFGDSRFCAPCHQFDADGLALEGKLLQNTYGEWLASPAARTGESCQDCHMPGGDHRVLGLHDREFVRAAIQFDASWQAIDDDTGRLQVSLGNIGAGHALPTYATGAVNVKMFLSDAHDGVIETSLRQRTAQRRLSVDGQHEVFDTRIPVGGAWSYAESFAVPPEAHHINVLVEVDPDHFYRRFFALLDPSAAGARALLEQARGRISDSPYILFARQIRITLKD